MDIEKPLNRVEHDVTYITFATYKELDKIAGADTESAELLKWMQENNVEFDSGNVRADVNGDHLLMSTSKKDFGTIAANPDTRDTKHMW